MLGYIFAGLCAGAIVMDWINQSEIKKLEKQNDDLGLKLHNMGYEIRRLMEDSDIREVKLKEIIEQTERRKKEINDMFDNIKKANDGDK